MTSLVHVLAVAIALFFAAAFGAGVLGILVTMTLVAAVLSAVVPTLWSASARLEQSPGHSSQVPRDTAR